MPISKEDAMELPKEKMQGAKVEELVEFLTEQACNAGEIAEFLGVRKAGVYTKLKRLVEDGILERVYDAKNVSYWFAA